MISPLAKIRIIDDDPAMLESWKFLLNSLGCDVVTYNSAKDFLEKDDPHPMGCILLDVRMPEMSGLELQELLKETVVVIIISLAVGVVIYGIDTILQFGFGKLINIL